MVISILTIGYGDIYPRTEGGRLFTLFIVPAGIIMFSYGFGSAASYFLEKHFPEKVREKRMEKKLKRLSGHIIICGSGNFAKQVYDEILTSQPDAAVLFTTLTAKNLNEHIEVAARANQQGSEAILEKAGAAHVVNPYAIGGRELALSIVQPSRTAAEILRTLA